MLPVVHRELLAASRRPGTYNARVGTAVVALVTIVWFYLVSGAGSPASSLGKSLFGALSIFAFVCSLLAGTWLTSDCLSSEKREGTLGLLFLTDLKGFDILFGKLASSSFASFYGLLAIVPLLAIAIVLGGVTLNDVGRVALLLANTMFFSLAVGLFVSTFSRNERKALFATVILLFLISIWPGVVFFYCLEVLDIRLSPEVESFFSLPSPLLTFFLSPIAQAAPTPNAAAWFFSSLAFVHLEAWLLLVLASRWLPRFANEGSKPIGERRHWVGRWRQWSHGEGESRLRYRRRLLDSNAFFWLSAREQKKPVHVWLMLGIVLAIWLPAAWKYPNYFADPETCFGMMFIIHGLLKVWFTSEVCVRLNEDRHSGGLELLLSTPLGVVEIARGQAAALRRQFLKPTMFVLALDFVLLVAISDAMLTFDKRSLNLAVAAGMVLLPVDLWALKWVGMWRALTQPKLDRALIGTWLQVLTVPWIVFAAVVSIQGLLQYMFGQTISTDSPTWVALWTLLNLINSLSLALRARSRFLAEFRVLATTRFDAPVVQEKGPAQMSTTQSRSRPTIAGTHLLKRVLGRHRWLAGFGVAAVVVALTLGVMRWRGRSLLEHQLREIQSGGEPVSVEDLASASTTLKEPNQAAQLVAAFPAMRRLGQFRLSKSTNPSELFTTLSGPLPKRYRLQYEQAVQGNAKILGIVREIDDFRQIEFPVPWHSLVNPTPGMIPAQPWWQISGLAELLQAEALLRIDQQDRAEAVRCIGIIIGLSRVLENVPLSSAQLSRFYSLNRGFTAMEHFLSSAAPSLSELVTLETWLRDTETAVLDTTLLRRALVNERAVFIESTRGSPAEITARLGMLMGAPPAASFALEVTQWTGSWDRLTAQGIRDHTAVLNVLDLPLHERQARLLQIESEIAGRSHSAMPQLQLFQGIWTIRVLKDQLGVITRLRAAQIALAIERWRLSSGASPSTALEEIVPQALEKIPLDPVDGQPLQYAREAPGPGYMIYGLGSHGSRQGGPSRPHPNRSMQPTFKVER